LKKAIVSLPEGVNSFFLVMINATIRLSFRKVSVRVSGDVVGFKIQLHFK
jgi:hypothetical protein